MNFLFYINDYIEDVVTFTALAKNYSVEHFCNTKVAGLSEIFISENYQLYDTLWTVTQVGAN